MLHIVIHLYQFQFHLVRLKANTCRLLEYLGYGFQFHLVRLKVDQSLSQTKFKKISIPFSTIKSFGTSLIMSWYKISIPFSTIKSCNMRSLKSLFIISIPFSTIKSSSIQGNNRLSKISIPFSTIKSAWSSYLMDLYNKFQFHLVRLKVIGVLISAIVSVYFNSI